MIIGEYSSIRDYAPLLPGLEEVLKTADEVKDLPVGRYPAGAGYILVQEGETVPMAESTYELHRKYIDIQVILEGCEEMAWTGPEGLETVIPYNEEKDAGRYQGPKDHHILITAGMFWTAFPNDAHQAISHTAEPHQYRKMVIKLPVGK